MLLISIFAFVGCIDAVEINHDLVGSVAQSAQHSGPLSVLPLDGKKKLWDFYGLPNLLATHSILPFLSFPEALNSQIMDPKKLIKYFASKDYTDQRLKYLTHQDMIDYSLRNLENNEISDQTRIDNLELFFENASSPEKLTISYHELMKIFENGKLNLLKYLAGKDNFFQLLNFKVYVPFSLAARNGHIEMVKWILQKNPSLYVYKKSVDEAISQDQKETVEVILEMLAKEKSKMQMDVYAEALGSTFFFKRRDYVDFILKKASESFKDSKSLSQWSEIFIKMYSQKKMQATVSTLGYFFSQKVWNPRTVGSILFAMSKASNTVVERIGMELLNPRFKFREAANGDPIEKALEMVSRRNQATYRRVKQVLENIQRKRSLDRGELDLSAKRPRLQEPVYLDGFGLGFYPVK